MDPYYIDDQITLWHGDSLEVLRTLPDESVNCVVTSPPYYGLRDYGEPGQYGLEPTPAAFVEQMRQVFAEVRRVLAGDGTLWLNIGDSYVTQDKGPDGSSSGLTNGAQLRVRHSPAFDRPRKNLLGMPWRLAFAMQDDGWFWRNTVIWSKTNGMPESVTDRLASRHEPILVMTRSPRYWFDLDAIRQPYAESTMRHAPRREFNRKDATAAYFGNPQGGLDRQPHFDQERAGRNPGDVWEFPTQPFAGAHFAVMPAALVERCVLAGCRPGGVVLDPFCGSGTTGMVALKRGRRFVGIDLSAKYLDLALKTRLAQTALIDEMGA